MLQKPRARRGGISELLPAIAIIALIVSTVIVASLIFVNHYMRITGGYFKSASNMTKNPIPGTFSAQLIKIAPAKYTIMVYNPADTRISISASIVCNITGELTLVYGPEIIEVDPGTVSFRTILLPSTALDADYCYLEAEQGPVIYKIPES